ncbi:T9SS type A sorting domain-containing protein [candidate division KSB1 bacterium]|nr:T9SS type A sorting domain-containing protein [candidate division KSB1 bacterium]RQW10012.1 MAG: T9SS C-terminal target domain-containing protein [candidate division KSB1 bacterium]
MRAIQNVLIIFLVLFWTISLTAQDPGTASLTHLWTFEDGTLNDQVGVAHGEFHGDNALVEAGDLVTFPNLSAVADSWVELNGGDIDLSAYNEVSISAWFTPALENTQWNSLWFFGDDGGGLGFGSDGICFQPSRGDDVARFWITSGNPSAPYNNEDGVVDVIEYNDLDLHHVVCEVNEVPEIVMYHNGVLIGSTALTSDPATGKDNSIMNISPNFARFAHSCYSADLPYLGSIHEIAIFNKALSDEEVDFLYNAGVNGFPVSSVKSKEAQLPKEFTLSQNHPNPFNPTTAIRYTLNQSEQVKLTVYDLLGNEVALLVDEFQDSGEHGITFNAQGLTSGVFFYQLRTETGTLTKKMIVMK